MKRYIKASFDPYDNLITVFNKSLSALNRYFKGDTKFMASVGSVYGATYGEIEITHSDCFLFDLRDLIDANPDCMIYEYVKEYLSNPLYLAVINNTENDYVAEYISGTPLDEETLAMNYADSRYVDEWYKEFYNDVLKLANQVAKSICEYLTQFTMNIEDSEVVDEDDFYEWIIR